MKIQLDNNGGGRAVVAAAKVVSCVDKIVRNTTPQNEAGLIITNEARNDGLQAVSENFGDAFNRTVLGANRSEVRWGASMILLRKKDDVRTINTIKLDTALMKSVEKAENCRVGNSPTGFIEGRPKAVRTRASVGLHGEHSSPDFINRERDVQERQIMGWIRVQRVQIKVPGRLAGRTKKGRIEFKEQLRFLIVSSDFNLSLLKDLDLVPPEMVRGTGMKVLSVLISFDSSTDLTALLPA